MTDVEAEIAALRAEVAQLRAEFLQKQTAANDGSGGGEGCDVGLPLVPIGGGGSHMGNKAGSVKFDGEATFASASDANVEVLTAKTSAEGEEEKGTITIGVYWK